MAEETEPNIAQKLLAEAIGAFFLFGGVLGSGVMALELAGGNIGVALIGNTLAVGAILYVLIVMVVPFKEWLEESQGVDFQMQGGNFANALRWQNNGEPLEPSDIWLYLGKFFDTEMGRQMPIAGAVEGINTLAEHGCTYEQTRAAPEYLVSASHGKRSGVDPPARGNDGIAA